MMGWIICLCDYSGIMARPWVEAGCRALLVDPQHPAGTTELDGIVRVGATIVEAFAVLGRIVRGEPIVFVAGFPPCTDLASSGARWWAEKAKRDRYFQARAALVAEQCRTIGAMSSILGKPDYVFDPFDYAGYCRADNYTKATCLWTGGGFVMPPPLRVNDPPSRTYIHHQPPGPERENIRSATPAGFAQAVFLANAPSAVLRKQQQSGVAE